MGLKSLLTRFEVSHKTADLDNESSRYLDNDDLRPLFVKDRTWGTGTYFTFWFSAMSIADWYGSSAAMSLGLSAIEAIMVVFGGRVVAACLISLNGRGGAMYRIPFPSLIRSSFGVYGGWWPVVSRIVLSVVYQGINLVQGGTCVYVMLHAIFPSISRLPNVMPDGAGITTGPLIGTLVLWVVFFASVAIPIPKSRPMIWVKAVVFTIAAVAMLAWCCTLAGGAGRLLGAPGTASGSERTWLLIKFFIIGFSSCATFTTNAADFQRYSRKPNDSLLGQLVGGPVWSLIVHLVGVVIASSSKVIFGELQWNPVLLLDQIQTANYTSANRAGCFFIALCFAYASVVSMILENILPAANDLTGLFPKYINYKRGAYIVGIIALAMNPWWLLGSASIFTAYLSSFGIFLASIIGVMLVHYYVICRGHVEVDCLYHGSKDGPYYYWRGINLRAYVAYFCGIIPSMDGFAGTVGRVIPLQARQFYFFAYPVGLLFSAIVYFLLCLWKPVPYQVSPGVKGWLEPKDYVRPDDMEMRATEVLEGTEEHTGNEADKTERVCNAEVQLKTQLKKDGLR